MPRLKAVAEKGNPVTSTPTPTEQNITILTQNLQQVTEMIASLTQNVSTMANNSLTANSSQIPSTSTFSINNRTTSQPIPPYDPADETNSIEKFLSNIDQLTKINNWDEHTTIYMATSHLQGLAKVWYNSQKKLDHTWDEWKALLRLSFPEEIDYQHLLTKILNRTKKADESMMTYYYEKMSLMELFDFNNKIKVNLLIGGITNPEIQAAAKAGQHEAPENLLQFLKTFNQDTFRKNTSRKMPSFKKGRVYKPRNASGPTRCFSCNELGHIAPNCPKKKGSTKKVYMTKDAQVGQNFKYFKNARLNGQGVHAFIDFGSSVMAINKSTVDALKIKYTKHAERLKGYGGAIVKTLGKTLPITIKIDECEATLEILIVPDDIQEIPLLVGQPFTEIDGFIVHKTSDELRFLKETCRRT